MTLNNDDWLDILAEFLRLDVKEVRTCIDLIRERLGDEKEGTCGALRVMHGIAHSAAEESPSDIIRRVDGVILDLTTKITSAKTFEEQTALGRQLSSILELLAKNLSGTKAVVDSLGKELTEEDVSSPNTGDLVPQTDAKVWLMHCLGCGSLGVDPMRIRLAAGGHIDVLGVRGYESCPFCDPDGYDDDEEDSGGGDGEESINTLH